MLKKFGAVCLAAVLLLTGCTLRPQENGSKVQSISRPAVESAELQFTHPPRYRTPQPCPLLPGG